jgi:hypothetical protein
MNLAVPIFLSELCRLAEVSRAGFYRWKTQAPSADPDMKLRDEIQRIALEFSYYGSRRVTRKPQEGAAADARGQPAMPAQAPVRNDHRLQSCSAGVSKSGAGYGPLARGTLTSASVASASVTSPGETPSSRTPSGRPPPSTSTIHFVPLPRLVLPTAEPLFRRRKAVVQERLLPFQQPFAVERTEQRSPRVEPDYPALPTASSAASRSPGTDTRRAETATPRRSATPTGCPRTAPLVRAQLRFSKQRLDQLPLRITQ